MSAHRYQRRRPFFHCRPLWPAPPKRCVRILHNFADYPRSRRAALPGPGTQNNPFLKGTYTVGIFRMHIAHIPKCHVFSHFLMIIFDYIIDYIFSGHFLMKVFF